MKKLLFIICIALIGGIFASCDKNDDNGKFDPNAKIYINGADKLLKNTRYGVDAPLTAAQICRLDSLILVGTKIEDDGTVTNTCLTFSYSDGFGCYPIDTINNRLVFEAANITAIDGNGFLDPNTGFGNYIIYRDVWEANELGELVIARDMDTLAYIPNAQRWEAYDKIKALWETENWDAIYEIFQNAFTFIPCTGEEYRALVEAGIE